MAFRKIADSELVGKGNMGQPDTPGVSTSEMQRIMDEIPREIIIPAFNELSEQLVDETAAASLGAEVPEGLPDDTPATAQGVMEAILESGKEHAARIDNPHSVTASQTGAYTKAESDEKLSASISAHANRTDNPHAVTAAQVGAYTKGETDAAIGQRVVEIGAGDMARAVYDPDALGADATVQLYTHTKSSTVHEFTGSGANGRAQLTANVAAGDTFTVNGAPVTAYVGAESAVDMMAGSTWSGRWVSFVYDEANDTLDFKAGGGSVTVSGLSAAAVKTGVTVTVKQGEKTLQTVTGSFTADATAEASHILSGRTAYVNGAKVTGAIPSKAAATYTPKATRQTIAAGQYLSGAQTVKGDAKLKAENIKSGTSVFGVTGSYYSKLACLYSTDAVFTARYEVDDEYIGISMNSYRPDLSGNPRYNGEITVKKTFKGICVAVPSSYTSIPKNVITTFAAGAKYNIVTPGEDQPYGLVIIRI